METTGPWVVGKPGRSLVPAQGSGHGRPGAAAALRSWDRPEQGREPHTGWGWRCARLVDAAGLGLRFVQAFDSRKL